MSAVARIAPAPRYGSALEVAAYTGLSLKTVRRRLKDGSLRGVRVGRRVLIPFEETDRRIAGPAPGPGRQPVMAPTPVPAPNATVDGPYVPPVSAEELARRNRGLVELLDVWESEGDEQEQRATLAVLREAQGERRETSF